MDFGGSRSPNFDLEFRIKWSAPSDWPKAKSYASIRYPALAFSIREFKLSKSCYVHIHTHYRVFVKLVL
jgi:hypothetical protein